MDVTAVVLHKGALAHYAVHAERNDVFEAHLLRYSGAQENEPPQDIEFSREGRHCTGSTAEQDLMDDIYNAVECNGDNGGFSSSPLNPNQPYV